MQNARLMNVKLKVGMPYGVLQLIRYIHIGIPGGGSGSAHDCGASAFWRLAQIPPTHQYPQSYNTEKQLHFLTRATQFFKTNSNYLSR